LWGVHSCVVGTVLVPACHVPHVGLEGVLVASGSVVAYLTHGLVVLLTSIGAVNRCHGLLGSVLGLECLLVVDAHHGQLLESPLWYVIAAI